MKWRQRFHAWALAFLTAAGAAAVQTVRAELLRHEDTAHHEKDVENRDTFYRVVDLLNDNRKAAELCIELDDRAGRRACVSAAFRH
jgi:hypothetical protein